ncbi:Rv3235 family protein [Phytoactinopolyspora halotolerans]|uniref:Uncharacterized protein n=1 Tax=Phytoactinopolyspora halotolerans TaxID=1981512 RepID=A0A6L9SCP3_9ACTN|nr:Rv3235 family protein [Phytoactinopolyspora halotolerans]NEE02464.1 hypothetical protein [Phytoactinopolyspora halotolerans]
MTPRTPTGHARPRARPLPVPVTDPPFDDELGTIATPRPRKRRVSRTASATAVQGTLALSVATSSSSPSNLLADRPPRRLGESPRTPERPAELPDPRRWSARLAQAAVESIQGRRPFQQLLRWTNDEVYEWLGSQVAARRGRPPGPRPSVRSVRVSEIDDSTFEAAAVLQIGDRVRALAMRCEAHRGRWVCTVFDVI